MDKEVENCVKSFRKCINIEVYVGYIDQIWGRINLGYFGGVFKIKFLLQLRLMLEECKLL
jgi:hypothetical protein